MNHNTLEDVKNSTKALIEVCKPTKIKKIPTLDDTIRGILHASSPARKAHATRKLKAYALSRSKEIKSTHNRVIAGVCAAVTKIMEG